LGGTDKIDKEKTPEKDDTSSEERRRRRADRSFQRQGKGQEWGERGKEVLQSMRLVTKSLAAAIRHEMGERIP
jgi:hypothetical protein